MKNQRKQNRLSCHEAIKSGLSFWLSHLMNVGEWGADVMKELIKAVKEMLEFDLHLCAIESVQPFYHRGAHK